MSENTKALAGQVALVTGGSRGIGRAISEQLAAQGARVAINYASNSSAADDVVGSLQASGVEAKAYGFDVSDPEAVAAGVKQVVSDFGGIDVLVNNAGIADDGLLVRTSPEQWQRTISINLSGCFYCAKAVAKPMMKARRGRIITISSVIGEMGNAGQAAYGASKAGVFGLTKSLARELGSRNITVNAVTPGYIQTDMTSSMSDDQTEALKSQIVLGRLGETNDVAEMVVFLASPKASYITGQVIGVNGGLYM